MRGTAAFSPLAPQLYEGLGEGSTAVALLSLNVTHYALMGRECRGGKDSLESSWYLLGAFAVKGLGRIINRPERTSQ